MGEHRKQGENRRKQRKTGKNRKQLETRANRGNFVKHLRIKISEKSLRQRFLSSLFCHFKPYILSQFLVLSLSPDNNVMGTSTRCVKLFFHLFLVLN